MYIRWTNYNCPHCGKTWRQRIITSPRLGPERRKCWNCEQLFVTPDSEWPRMSRKQRIAYVLNEQLFAWLFVFGLWVWTAFIVAETLSGRLEWIGIGFLVVVAPLLLGKWLSISLSKRRVAKESSNAIIVGSGH